MPFKLNGDDLGNQILRFCLLDLPPYATKIIRIKAVIRITDRLNGDAATNLSLYLKPEKYIESANPQILRLAEKLKTSDPAQTTKNIFRWVSHNVRYMGYVSRPRGALYTLSHKKGDCTEFMYLFTALCRAAGIPARCIGGYICRENSILKPQDYHNWAEFYLDGKWQISDPLNGVFMHDRSEYIAMRIISDRGSHSVSKFDRFKCDSSSLKVAMNQ